jgi:hypothetical protein
VGARENVPEIPFFVPWPPLQASDDDKFVSAIFSFVRFLVFSIFLECGRDVHVLLRSHGAENLIELRP